MPSLSLVTPVILTLDEEANIGRTLCRLSWARRVVVVDGGSKDRTLEIARTFENACLFQRDFDDHPRQWKFGLKQVHTEWALTLDADYQVAPQLAAEIREVPDDTPFNGFVAEFDYLVLGRRLQRHLYPPRLVLFRTEQAVVESDGHTQRIRVDGATGRLRQRILHDDRKPLARWLSNQVHYARREAEKLTSSPWSELSWPDRIRRIPILAPPLVMLYTLFAKGLILYGKAGWHYAMERAFAEMVLALTLLQRPPGPPK